MLAASRLHGIRATRSHFEILLRLFLRDGIFDAFPKLLRRRSKSFFPCGDSEDGYFRIWNNPQKLDARSRRVSEHVGDQRYSRTRYDGCKQARSALVLFDNAELGFDRGKGALQKTVIGGILFARISDEWLARRVPE
jgi:hypothetical protein